MNNLLYHFTVESDIIRDRAKLVERAQSVSPAFGKLLEAQCPTKSLPASIKAILKSEGYACPGQAQKGCGVSKNGVEIANLTVVGGNWELIGPGPEVQRLLTLINDSIKEVQNTLDYFDLRKLLEWTVRTVKAEPTKLRGLFKCPNNTRILGWLRGVAQTLEVDFECWEVA